MLAQVGRRFWLFSPPFTAFVISGLLVQALGNFSLPFISPAAAFALEIGESAPNFSLQGSDGKNVSIADFKGKTVVLEWFNAGCPFVMKHYRAKNMQNLQKRYTEKGVVWLTINSTNTDHKDFLDYSAAAKFRNENAVGAGTYLIDKTGEVGMSYGAKTTPHFFIVDTQGKIAYQGAIDDDSDTGSDPLQARNYVAEALDMLLANKPVAIAKTAPYGCSVKFAS